MTYMNYKKNKYVTSTKWQVN